VDVVATELVEHILLNEGGPGIANAPTGVSSGGSQYIARTASTVGVSHEEPVDLTDRVFGCK